MDLTAATFLNSGGSDAGLDASGKVNLPNLKSLELLNISAKNFYGKKFIKLYPEFKNLFSGKPFSKSLSRP